MITTNEKILEKIADDFVIKLFIDMCDELNSYPPSFISKNENKLIKNILRYSLLGVTTDCYNTNKKIIKNLCIKNNSSYADYYVILKSYLHDKIIKSDLFSIFIIEIDKDDFLATDHDDNIKEYYVSLNDKTLNAAKINAIEKFLNAQDGMPMPNYKLSLINSGISEDDAKVYDKIYQNTLNNLINDYDHDYSSNKQVDCSLLS